MEEKVALSACTVMLYVCAAVFVTLSCTLSVITAFASTVLSKRTNETVVLRSTAAALLKRTSEAEAVRHRQAQ